MPLNRNLEAMARQLYDYWFVQFDFPDENGRPYKSSGGNMVWNEKLKRNIPEGWEDTTLGIFCEMYQPKTIGTNELNPDGKYWVYGANGIVGKYDSYNHEQSEVAMACRGNSCGVINRTLPKSWITGNAMVIKTQPEIHNEYIYHTIPYLNIQGAISGSGQPQLTRENLSSILMCKPSTSVLKAFSDLVSPYIELVIENEILIQKLINQRDDILPLLMNGQVSVMPTAVNCDLVFISLMKSIVYNHCLSFLLNMSSCIRNCLNLLRKKHYKESFGNFEVLFGCFRQVSAVETERFLLSQLAESPQK